MATFLERQNEIRRQQGLPPLRNTGQIEGFGPGSPPPMDERPPATMPPTPQTPPLSSNAPLSPGWLDDNPDSDLEGATDSGLGPEGTASTAVSPLIAAARPPQAAQERVRAQTPTPEPQPGPDLSGAALVIVDRMASYMGRAVVLDDRAYQKLAALVLEAVSRDALAVLSQLKPKRSRKEPPCPEPKPEESSSPSPPKSTAPPSPPKKRGRPRKVSASVGNAWPPPAHSGS